MSTELYWCGCVRETRWVPRCERHTDLEHDEEPPSRREEEKVITVAQPTVWASAPVFIQGAIKEALTRRAASIAMNLGSGCESGEHIDHIQVGAALKWLGSRVVIGEEKK